MTIAASANVADRLRPAAEADGNQIDVRDLLYGRMPRRPARRGRNAGVTYRFLSPS